MLPPNSLRTRKEIRLSGRRHDFSNDLVLVGDLDFFTRGNPSQNLRPLFRQLLNARSFHWSNDALPKLRKQGAMKRGIKGLSRTWSEFVDLLSRHSSKPVVEVAERVAPSPEFGISGAPELEASGPRKPPFLRDYSREAWFVCIRHD